MMGMMAWLFGYRFYMPMLFVGGFVFAAVGTDYICWSNGLSDTHSAWVVPVTAILFGGLCVLVYQLGCFILGANFGVAIALLLNGILISNFENDNVGLGVTAAVFGVLLGFLVVCNHHHLPEHNPCGIQKVLIFLKTSTVGAYLLVRGMAYIWDYAHDTPNDYPFELDLVKMSSIPTSYHVYVGVTAIMAILGALVQMRFTHLGDCGLFGREEEEAEAKDEFSSDAESQKLMEGLPTLAPQQRDPEPEPEPVMSDPPQARPEKSAGCCGAMTGKKSKDPNLIK